MENNYGLNKIVRGSENFIFTNEVIRKTYTEFEEHTQTNTLAVGLISAIANYKYMAYKELANAIALFDGDPVLPNFKAQLLMAIIIILCKPEQRAMRDADW